MKANRLTRETINQLGVTDRGFPEIKVGDTVAVAQRIIEGTSERLQTFEGDILAIKNNGASTTFVVRRIGAHGVAVERIFPYYSTLIASLTVLRHGDVRRAKLYYMRKRIGKQARVQEKVLTKAQKEHEAHKKA